MGLPADSHEPPFEAAAERREEITPDCYASWMKPRNGRRSSMPKAPTWPTCGDKRESCGIQSLIENEATDEWVQSAALSSPVTIVAAARNTKSAAVRERQTSRQRQKVKATAIRLDRDESVGSGCRSLRVSRTIRATAVDPEM